jgi:hypothetical protein
MLQRRKAETMKALVDEWRRSAKIELLVPLEPAAPGPAPSTGK